jgi:ribosomal protein L29
MQRKLKPDTPEELQKRIDKIKKRYLKEQILNHHKVSKGTPVSIMALEIEDKSIEELINILNQK